MKDFVAIGPDGSATLFLDVPDDAQVELAATKGPGTYRLRALGSNEGIATVLDVQNTGAPAVTGTPAIASTLSGSNGTWSGVLDATTPFKFQWAEFVDALTINDIPGATAATFKVPDTFEGKSLVLKVAAQTARGQWTPYVLSNVVVIPSATFTVTNAEWTFGEDPDDAETRETIATLTLLNDLPAGKKPRFYKGPNPAGDPTQTAWMTGSGRNWSFDGASKAAVGSPTNRTTLYHVIYMQSEDVSGNPVGPIVAISNILSAVYSSVPSKPAAPTVVPGTAQTGDIKITPPALPTNNGRSVTKWGYTVNSTNPADIIELSGGAALTQRTVNVAGTQAVSIRIWAYNVNGWSPASDPVSVTPPVVVAGTNTRAPELNANLYGGGAWTPDLGVWTGNVTLTGDVEQSNDGATGWATYAAAVTDSGGVWPVSSVTGQYFRLKVTPSVGSPVYSAVIGPIKQGLDAVLSQTSPVRRYRKSVGAALGGWSMAGGIWFSAKLFYNGSAWTGWPLSLGSTNGLYNFANSLSKAEIRSNTFLASTPSLPTPSQPGWYHYTWYYRTIGGVHYATIMRNDEVSEDTGTGTLTAANFTYFSLFSRGDFNNEIYCAGICDLAWGTGDPTAMHAWCSQTVNDAMPSIKDYDFVTDTGVVMKSLWRLARTRPYTYDEAVDLADDLGLIANTWTANDTGPTNTAFINRKPAFVSAPVPFVVPDEVYISPAFGTADIPRSIQSKKPGTSPPTYDSWVTGRQYSIGDRVMVSGTIYRCMSTHTSGTWATDLAANKWAVFVFTINSLTHSVLGNILPTVIGGYFTCETPGIVTASVTLGGVISPTPSNWGAGASYAVGDRRKDSGTGNIYECIFAHTSGTSFSADRKLGYWVFQYGTLTATSEIFAVNAIPAAPRYANLFRGNGLVCAIEPYPQVTGAGQTFATVADLQAAINARVGLGGTITVNNVGDHTQSLVVAAGDYAGLVVEAVNPEGIKVDRLTLNGCKNITVRGVAAVGKVSCGVSGVSNASATYTTGIWLDHCRIPYMEARGVSSSSSTLMTTNCISWDAELEPGKPGSGYTKIIGFKRFTFVRSGFGDASTANVFVVAGIKELIMDRYILYNGIYTGATHADMFQTVPLSGFDNIFGGFIQNGWVHDFTSVGDGTNEFQGLFQTDCKFQNYMNRRNMVRVMAPNNIIINKALCNVRLEENNSSAQTRIGGGLADGSWVKNNIKSGDGSFLSESVLGFNDSNLSIAGAGLSSGDVWPDYNLYPNSWRCFRPAPGYESRGASLLFAELEAKRVQLGL